MRVVVHLLDPAGDARGFMVDLHGVDIDPEFLVEYEPQPIELASPILATHFKLFFFDDDSDAD